MAQIRIQNVRKEFGAFTAVQSSLVYGGGRRVLHAVGPVRLRQDDDLADDGGPRTADQW